MSTPRPLALVTGGNRGIGRGIVAALARRGFDIALVDLAESEDTASTIAAAAAAGAAAHFVAGDIAAVAHHEELLDAALAGRFLHTLVNNAGVSTPVRGDVLEVTPEEFDPVLDVNLRGTFFLTQAVARRMLHARPGASGRSIITITSANAVIVAPDRAAYCFAKTALSMMVKVFAVRLAAEGVACYEIRPGIIRTDMTRVAAARYDGLIAQGLLPEARWGEPADVGRAAAALAAGELSYMTGAALDVAGGMHIHRV